MPLGKSVMGLLVDVRSRVRAALVMAGLVLAGGSHAAGLFLPVGPGDPAADGSAGRPIRAATRNTAAVSDAWERRVRIARPELSAAREDVANAGAGRLLLNVRDGVRLDVVVERTAPTRWGYSLSGRVAGRNGGFVTLVVHEEAVAGSIWTPNSAYELSYLGGGIHALRDVTSAPPALCGGSMPAELSGWEVTAQDGAQDGAEGSVVDILVVWTPAKEEAYGGKAQALSQIDITIASTNDALERSGALVSLNLVGAERVDYSEVADSAINLSRLTSRDDGQMDQVHDRREALGADLVYLLVAKGSGRAWRPGSFAVGGLGRNFAHEVGHNFGIGHERYEFVNTTGADYEYGFTTGWTGGRCVSTIMSYGLECRARWAPFYASPWRYGLGQGRPVGVSRFSKERGARGPADAVLTLNRNRHRVANFLPSRRGE